MLKKENIINSRSKSHIHVSEIIRPFHSVLSGTACSCLLRLIHAASSLHILQELFSPHSSFAVLFIIHL
jgi:hypothetical protein